MLQKVWSFLHQSRLSLLPIRAELLSDNVAAPAEVSYENLQASATSSFHTLPRDPTVPTVIDDDSEANMQYPKELFR
jgi:hypothetical protein